MIKWVTILIGVLVGGALGFGFQKEVNYNGINEQAISNIHAAILRRGFKCGEVTQANMISRDEIFLSCDWGDSDYVYSKAGRSIKPS